MKRLWVALFLWLGLAGAALAQGQVGPPNQILCNKVATFSGLSANTVLISAVTNQRIIVCGWHVTSTSATSTTFSITAGTQTTTPCDTGTITFTPALNVTLTAPSADHVDFGVLGTNLSQAVCITPSNAGISGLVYYSQF
jgi:hypothetical protein